MSRRIDHNPVSRVDAAFRSHLESKSEIVRDSKLELGCWYKKNKMFGEIFGVLNGDGQSDPVDNKMDELFNNERIIFDNPRTQYEYDEYLNSPIYLAERFETACDQLKLDGIESPACKAAADQYRNTFARLSSEHDQKTWSFQQQFEVACDRTKNVYNYTPLLCEDIEGYMKKTEAWYNEHVEKRGK